MARGDEEPVCRALDTVLTEIVARGSGFPAEVESQSKCTVSELGHVSFRPLTYRSLVVAALYLVSFRATARELYLHSHIFAPMRQVIDAGFDHSVTGSAKAGDIMRPLRSGINRCEAEYT